MGFLVEKRSWETDLKAFEELISSTSISENNVFNIPIVSSSIDLISGVISMLDFGLYKKIKCDKIEEIEKDHRLFLLNNEPNYVWNATQFKERLATDLILYGANYNYIDKVGNEVKALYYVKNTDVTVMEDTSVIKKTGQLRVAGEDYEPFNFLVSTIRTKNGLDGAGILKKNESLLKLALNINLYLDYLYSTKGNKKGIWSANKMAPKIFDEFKAGVREAEQDQNSSYIINGDEVKYNTITSDAREMQTAEVIESLNKSLKAIFKIPSNIDSEEGYKSFIKLCITPLLNAIEAAVNKALLLESEKEDNLFFKFKLDELTRASIKDRFEAYKDSLESGIETINEIRAKEGLESVEGLDIFKFNLADVIFDRKTKEFWTPNTNTNKNINQKVGDNIEDITKTE